MRYFERYWDEPRGAAHSDWGCSWWFFETDEAGIVSRQVEVYDHGPTLRYAESRLSDDFGMLSDQPLDLYEFAKYEIAPGVFEQVWGS